MTTDQRPLTCDDYIDAAEAAQRGEAWAQAAVLWLRASETCSDVDKALRYTRLAADCRQREALNDRLEKIAKRTLRIPTLTERRSDSLDFHELGVWQLKQALKAAYKAGQNDAK